MTACGRIHFVFAALFVAQYSVMSIATIVRNAVIATRQFSDNFALNN